jgi:hypothetical protein
MKEDEPAEVRVSKVLPELNRVLGEINVKINVNQNQILNEVGFPSCKKDSNDRG